MYQKIQNPPIQQIWTFSPQSLTAQNQRDFNKLKTIHWSYLIFSDLDCIKESPFHLQTQGKKINNKWREISKPEIVLDKSWVKSLKTLRLKWSFKKHGAYVEAKTLTLIEKLPKTILTWISKIKPNQNNYSKQKPILTEIPLLKKLPNIYQSYRTIHLLFLNFIYLLYK